MQLKNLGMALLVTISYTNTESNVIEDGRTLFGQIKRMKKMKSFCDEILEELLAEKKNQIIAQSGDREFSKEEEALMTDEIMSSCMTELDEMFELADGAEKISEALATGDRKMMIAFLFNILLGECDYLQVCSERYFKKLKKLC